MPKRVLITGIGGFIGAHFLNYYLKNTDWKIVGTDSFRHKGISQRLIDIVGLEAVEGDRVEIYKHDLTVPIPRPLENLLVGDGLDFVINLASDSAVERSIINPEYCWKNNCELMFTVLEFVRKIKPKLFLHTSTDETYGEAATGSAHHEWDAIIPSSIYAASKAAQEALCISYWRTYNIPLIITNVMNNIGEGQDPEKFLPRIVEYVSTDKSVPIYCESPEDIGTRVYQHAENHADAVLFLSKQEPTQYGGIAKNIPDRYNVCGEVELNNLELAQMVAKVMGKELKYHLVQSDSARPGYDRRYALDNAKLKGLGWKPPMSFEDTLKRIVEWYLDNPHWI